MNLTLFFWLYIINSTLLIVHEIDSAYWQEWKLLNPKDDDGINGFLIIHIPLIFMIMYGLILVEKNLLSGMIISLVVGSCGIFAFFFHLYHLRKGKEQFNTIVSKSIILLTFIVSIIQIIVTVLNMI